MLYAGPLKKCKLELEFKHGSIDAACTPFEKMHDLDAQCFSSHKFSGFGSQLKARSPSVSSQPQNFFSCSSPKIWHVFLAKAQSYIPAIEVSILEHEHATVIPILLFW